MNDDSPTPWGRCNSCREPIEANGSFTHCRSCAEAYDAMHVATRCPSCGRPEAGHYDEYGGWVSCVESIMETMHYHLSSDDGIVS